MSKLSRSLRTFSVNAATLTAAGISISAKSDAAIIAVGGSGQTDANALLFQAVSSGGSAFTGLSVSPGSGCDGMLIALSGGTIEAYTQTGGDAGFSFYIDGGSVFFPAEFQPEVDLSQMMSWETSAYFGPLTFPGQVYPFGRRYSEAGGGDYYYGWTTIEIGSLIHQESYANDVVDGSITLGIVPEPSSISLLALGGLGIAAQRKRRKSQA